MIDETNGRPAGAAPNAPPRPEFVAAVGAAMTAVGCVDAARHARFLGSLAMAAVRFEIRTRERVANWLGQLGHESGGFQRLEENLNYKDPEHIARTFARPFAAFKTGPIDPKTGKPTRVFDPESIARAAPFVGKPEALANFVYARDDLGNVNPGDGWRYRGRSPIQITGLANYLRAQRALNLPLTADPDLAADPKIGALIAGWWWWDKGLNRVADRGPAGLDQITRTINGGTHGLEDRRRRTEAARLALAPFPENLAA